MLLSVLIGLYAHYLSAAQVLNWGNGTEPKELDPQTSTGVPEYHIESNIFEGLVTWDPRQNKIIPGQAEKWTISKDGLTYTFTIRDNAKWSNGEKVTAEDFRYSIIRLIEPKTASEYSSYGFYIKNGEKYFKGELKDASQVGVKAVDPKTLVITLERPTSYFLQLLMHHTFFPVSKAVVDKFGTRWTRPENIVSNGPFKLTKWEMNKIISVEKNPHYYDAKSIKLEGANFHPTENLNTEEKMYRSGQLHVTNDVPLEKIPTWKKEDPKSLRMDPLSSTYFYVFNVAKPPFNDPRVRKAFSYAVDRKEIVELVTKVFEDPLYTLTPPGIGGFKATHKYPGKFEEQLKEAKKLLADAGYPEGKNFPEVELLYNTHEGHKKIAEALQNMLKKNLKVNVKLYNQEWKVFLSTQSAHNFQMSRRGWVADFDDAMTFMELFLTGNGNNAGLYSNKKFDDVVAKASSELNEKKRFELYQQAENILAEDVPFLPIYVYKRKYLISPKVEGWYPSLQERHMLRYVSIKD